MPNVAINGLGRIGRAALKILLEMTREARNSLDLAGA